MNDLFWQKVRAEKQFNVIDFPYALFISEVESIRVKKSLRFIPKKRLVVVADWQDKKVLVKFFISSTSAKRHFEREKNNIEQLTKAKIDTPKLLFSGQVPNQNVYFLVLEYLDHSVSLNEEFESADLLPKTCRVISKLHQHHYLHQDVHLDNFLVQEQKIYLIDFASIKKNYFGLPLSFSQKLKNLALFAAQFEDKAIQQKILFEYMLINCKQVDSSIKQRFQRYLQYWQQKRKRKYLKKIFRGSTVFYCEKNWSHYLVCKRSYVSALQHFFDDPKHYLKEKKVTILKDGNSSTILKFHVDQFTLVVKRYNIKDFIHGLKRAFQTTRAYKSWYYSHLLQINGIYTPEPIAFYEKRFFFFKGISYFLMEEIVGESLLHYLLDKNKTLEQKQQIVLKMKELFSQLHKLQIAHGDTKPMNYLVSNNNVFLIDLDGMQQFQNERKFKNALKQDQKRFLKDWKKYPELWPLFRDFFSDEIN